jgi:hypothetical protein
MEGLLSGHVLTPKNQPITTDTGEKQALISNNRRISMADGITPNRKFMRFYFRANPHAGW